MLKLTVICLLALAATRVDSLDLLPSITTGVGGKVVISDGLGKVVENVGGLLTGAPLFISQGVKGTGDWLAGVLDKITVARDEASQKRRSTLLERYKNAVLNKNPDTTLRFPELCKKYGYPVEEYEVKTEDGYLLTVFRIPYGVKSPLIKGKKRPVVFLMHGLIDSSDDWIIMGPEKSIGYILADAGYDVWLGNARGNTHSRKHVSLKPVNVGFWQFGWDEIGYFDLPAMIDHVLVKTEEKSLSYIGHSQGTTSFFVMCSRRPEYNAKIKIMFALAPIAWMSNMVSPMIRLLSPQSKALGWVTKILGVGEFLPSSSLMAAAGGILCRDRALTQDVCTNSLFLVCGFNLEQMNMTMLPVVLGHTPAGSSVRQFLHYAQGVVSKDFRRFDHGYIRNMREYGTRVPPSYDMSKVTCPVALYYSTNDWLSSPIDVTTLSGKLGKMVDMYLVPHKQFNHMDYMWAVDSYKLFIERILTTLPKY